MWCIEDAEGKCLRHAASIHGRAAAKDEAIALAERANRPSEIRRKQERAESARLLHVEIDAEWENEKATPFYEIFAEAFDLADPDLWKSNSFSMLRPRLLIEVRAAIAEKEHELHDRRMRDPKSGRLRSARRAERESRLREARRVEMEKLERDLARAREILALLEGNEEARP